MPLGAKIKFKPKITSRRTAGAREKPSHLRTPPGQEAQVAFAIGAESPWSPNHAFFPLKALSQLCSVTNSITNVTQFVWQDVIFFFLLTLLFLVTTLSQAFSDSLSAPSWPYCPAGWMAFSPAVPFAARPPLPSKSIFHLLSCSILIPPESP